MPPKSKAGCQICAHEIAQNTTFRRGTFQALSVKSCFWAKYLKKKVPTNDNMLGITELLCLLKAKLKTKNSTKRLCSAVVWLSFWFQLDLLGKHLITLTVVAFTLRNILTEGTLS